LTVIIDISDTERVDVKTKGKSSVVL